MKFKSRDGKPRRISSTTGHVAIVSGEWRELPEHMHDAAYAAGCVSEDMVAALAEDLRKAGKGQHDGLGVDEQIPLVVAAVKEMLARQQEDDFTKAGMPNKAVVNSIVGFTVHPDAFARAWEQINAEAGD